MWTKNLGKVAESVIVPVLLTHLIGLSAIHANAIEDCVSASVIDKQKIALDKRKTEIEEKERREGRPAESEWEAYAKTRNEWELEIGKSKSCWLKRIGNGEKSMEGALLPDVDLSGKSLVDVNLNTSFLDGVKLNGTDLSNAVLANSLIRGSQLNKAKLSEADLTSVNLFRSDMSEADFTGATMINAVLDGTVMREAVLKNANLQGAKLQATNLYKANLSGANLTNAKLNGGTIEYEMGSVDYPGADLSQADLTGADLTGADFTGATLRGAKVSRSTTKGIDFGMWKKAGAVIVE